MVSDKLNDVQNHVEDEDTFSKLSDDILLYILGKSNIHACIRAGFLSTRWRHLPFLLPHVFLDISDFMSTPISQAVIDEAMEAMTRAARICLQAAPGAGREETTPKTVILRPCLTGKHLYDIGKLVSEAIEHGEVKSLELALPTAKPSEDCDVLDMLKHGENLGCFFGAFPSLFKSLTKLCLHNARFGELGIHHILNSCQQLQHLILNNCDTGYQSVLKINVPNSKVSYLKLRACGFENVEFICLPKLVELHLDSWSSLNIPFSLGFLPCLEELNLACALERYQSGVSLSELLRGTTGIKALTLDFQGEKIWMLPERNKLYASFNKLSKMFIHGIFIKFGLLWTIALLEAAPSLKTFGIKVWDHVCDVDRETYRKAFSKRTNPWEKDNKLNISRHLQLTRFEFGGFMAIKKHVGFVRVIMAYAPNLEAVLLEDKGLCESCDAINKKNLTCSSAGSMYPKNKYEQDIILNQIRDGLPCSVQIMFK